MSCVCRRRGSDTTLLWLRHRSAAAAPIGPLAWELPYATSVALKDKKAKKKKKKGISLFGEGEARKGEERKISAKFSH